MEELAHFYHPEDSSLDSPPNTISPQRLQHQVNFLGEAENISYQGTSITANSTGTIDFSEPILTSNEIINFLTATNKDDNEQPTFSLRLVRFSRTFGPDQSNPQLRIPHSTFRGIFQAIEADPTIKYLLQSDYDGFHHRRQSTTSTTTSTTTTTTTNNNISTFYLGSSVSSLLWTFDHKRLITRAVQISRGWSEGDYTNNINLTNPSSNPNPTTVSPGHVVVGPGPGTMRQQATNHQDDLRRALRTFQQHAGSPYYLAVASCVAAGKTFDEKTDLDLKAIRKVEGRIGYGPFKRKSYHQVSSSSSSGKSGGGGGDGRRRKYDVLAMDEMTESIQLAGAASAGAANRRRNILIMDQVLGFVAKDQDRHLGDDVEGEGEGVDMMARGGGKMMEKEGGKGQERGKGLVELVPLLKQQNGCLRDYLKYLKDRSDRLSTVLLALLTHADAVSNYELAEACKRDSSSMKTVAVMTMAFLPGTFFSAVWAMPSLNWTDPNEAVIQDGFGLYWGCSISLTFFTFGMWYFVTARTWIFNLFCAPMFGRKRHEDLDMEIGIDEKLFGRT